MRKYTTPVTHCSYKQNTTRDLLFRPTNAQIYINNILYTVTTSTCFYASASSSGSLILVLAKATKLLKLLKLQLNKISRLKC